MQKQYGFARVACIALVLALAGFSYAIATAGRSTEVATVAARTVSSNLNFSNPFVDPTLKSTLDRDLGDAVIGSAVVRRVTATGGVRPYSFTSTSVSTNSSLGLDSSGLFHTLPVTPASGTQLTTYGPLTGTPGNFRFNVTVADNSGTNVPKTEPYRLSIFSNSTTAFRFAITSLSNATQFNEYADYISTINGHGPLSYTVSNVTAGGTSAASLESLGLTIGKDGQIFGIPLKAGAITFTVVAKDSTGATASPRTGVGSSQTFTINVAGNSVIQDVIVVTSLTCSGDSAVGGKDKISISGVYNPLLFSSIGTTITLRLNGYVITGTIGSRGKISNLSLQDFAARAKVPTLKGTVNGKGQFKLQVSNESFGRSGLLGTIVSNVNAMVEVQIGTKVDGFNAVSLNNKGRGTKFGLGFKLGQANKKSGPLNASLGGAFILTSVAGKDDTKGATGDSFKVGIIAVPPSGITFAGATKATVSVGTSFTDSPSVTSSKGIVKTGRIDAKQANKVTRLSLSEKGKGSYQTSFLASSQTGIKLSSAGTSTGVPYATGITINSTTPFGGVGSLLIFPKGKGYTSAQK